MTDYAPQTWQDGAAGQTPINAARLLHIEQGVDTAHNEAHAAQAAADAAQVKADSSVQLTGAQTIGGAKDFTTAPTVNGQPIGGSGDYVSKAGGDTITASAAAVKPLVVKGAASQTANLLEAQNSAGTVLAHVPPDGGVYAGAGYVCAAAGLTAATYLPSGAAAQKALVVRGAASQTANLAEFQNSSGTVLAQIRSEGDGHFSYGNFGGLVYSGSGSRLTSNPQSASERGLVIRGAASQTANLAEFQNSSGTAALGVTAGSKLFFLSSNNGLIGGSIGSLAGYMDVVNAATGTLYKIPVHNP